MLLGATFVQCQKMSDNGMAADAPRAFPIAYGHGMKEKAVNYANILPAGPAFSDLDISPEMVALGKKLYYDKRLSGDGTQSCNTCHNLETFGVDNKPLSKGIKGEEGTRNSPTVLNAAVFFSQFWDGRAKTVEEQAGGPILNPVEMAMPSEAELEKRLRRDEEYKTLFSRVFPGETEPLTFGNVVKALGAFERTLITPSRFDAFLGGDEEALNVQEKRGLSLFVDLSCIKCHSGNTLGGNIFQKFGLVRDYWGLTNSVRKDEGLFLITRDPADKYVFKVPSLRNIEKTAPYFHDGSVEKLEDAIRIMANLQLGIDLSPSEVDDIKAFLKTLTGTVPASALQ